MQPRMLIICLLIFVALPIYTVLSGQAPQGRDFRTADRSSAGLAPGAETTPEPVVQVYFARALNWRGIFGVHTWIATKAANATQYTVHQVIGWRIYRDLPAVVSSPGIPDARWFGNEPTLIADLRGDAAANAIQSVFQRVGGTGETVPPPTSTPSVRARLAGRGDAGTGHRSRRPCRQNNRRRRPPSRAG